MCVRFTSFIILPLAGVDAKLNNLVLQTEWPSFLPPNLI